MTDEEQPPKRAPRKRPKLSLLQILFIVAAVGVILTLAHQHGAL